MIQYAGSVKPITSDFTYRYYKYSEVFAAFLPVFLVLAVKRKSRAAILAAAVAFIAWLSVLLSLSRTSFISGLCGIGLLILLILVFRRDTKYLKKLFACVGVLIAITVSTQAFFLVGEPTTLDRIALNENTDRKSMDVRFLYWGLAFESFKSKPITGVGADNYISDYRNARERYSSLDPENPVLESNEENLPERAHNEYLQILSELGFIGILLFAWFLIGIAVLFFIYRNGRPSMLTLGSIAGMTAFLVSALASSYSFRIPANGLSFFFLLALFVQSLKKETGPADQKDLFRRSGVKKWIVAAGLFVSGVMIVFSLVRGVSLMFLANSQNTQDKAISAKNLQTATYLDPGNGLFKYYEGARLLNLNKPAASIPPLRYAIDSGIATSAVYFSLISAQRIAGKEMEAANTYAEALRVYPRSVFLRTAYASFLRERGQHNLADAEYTTAMKIDSKQAKSWYLAFTEGLQELSTRSVKEPELLPSAELYPGSGALALVNYEILRDKQK